MHKKNLLNARNSFMAIAGNNNRNIQAFAFTVFKKAIRGRNQGLFKKIMAEFCAKHPWVKRTLHNKNSLIMSFWNQRYAVESESIAF